MQIQVLHDPEPVLYTTTAGGRPKKYTKEFIDNAGDKLQEWIDESDQNIFIEGFCYKYRIDEDLIGDFSRQSEKFSGAVKHLKAKQKLVLFEKGLDKTYSHPMCTLILGHNHGIYQKTEQKLTGDVANPLSFLLSSAESQSSKELIACEQEHVYDRAVGFDEGENTEPVLADQQPVSNSGQDGTEAAL